MKTLIAVVMLLTLAAPAHAVTCTGRVKIDAMNELVGGKVLYVGDCVFLPALLQRRILRSCPTGSYCRVEGASSGNGEVGNEIDTVTSVTTTR